MCLYPKLIPNRKYIANKKNGGIIPPIIDPRVSAVTAGCGNCIECRKQKAREWQARLQEDIKQNTTGKFITLTFSNQSIAKINKQIPETFKDKKGKEHKLQGYRRDNAIATYAIRHFLERYRKKYKKSIRHWLVTELGHGNTEHIHIHGIIWLPTLTKWEAQLDEIRKIWGYGFIWDGYIENEQKKNYVNEATINYAVKYIHKVDADHKYYKSKIHSSAGIGSNYVKEITYEYCEEYIYLHITKTGERKWRRGVLRKKIKDGYITGDWVTNKYNKEGETDEAYQTRSGHKIGLPIYYRNKIYNDNERELLWLQKLDKQERWVCGTKTKTDKSMDEYFALLKHHRQRSNYLGYGNDQKNWKQEEYETNRRNWQLDRRINTKKAIA